MIINKKSNGRDPFRYITDTQHQDAADPNTIKSNIETYLESNVDTLSNVSRKSSPEFTIVVSPSNRINKTSTPSNIHTLLVASVKNDISALTQKIILEVEAELSVLKSHVDCELSALTSTFDAFFLIL